MDDAGSGEDAEGESEGAEEEIDCWLGGSGQRGEEGRVEAGGVGRPGERGGGGGG